jgi:hypothetical protein
MIFNPLPLGPSPSGLKNRRRPWHMADHISHFDNFRYIELMTAPEPTRRCYQLTPAHFLVLLLDMEGILLLGNWLHWIPKGWAVLNAVAAVGVFLLLMLLWFILTLFFRWRFQFSLRSLLVLMIAVAIPCSWLAVEMKAAKEQRETVEAIVDRAGAMDKEQSEAVEEIAALVHEQQINGDIHHGYDYNCPKECAVPIAPAWVQHLLGRDFFASVIWLDFSGIEITDAELEHLLKGLNQLKFMYLSGTNVTDSGLKFLNRLSQLNGLDLANTKITDAGLEDIKELSQLQYLNLWNTKITDAGMEQLKKLPKLQSLYLGMVKITDAGLGHIKGLTTLQSLSLVDSKITDAGLEHLKGLTNLESLNLSDNNITDAGLEHLKGLTTLQTLYLSDTKVTEEGVKKLQHALPKCRINYHIKVLTGKKSVRWVNRSDDPRVATVLDQLSEGGEALGEGSGIGKRCGFVSRKNGEESTEYRVRSTEC